MLANRRHLVVIPAYNEQSALRHTVAKLQSLPAAFELLIVNDGSTDLTAQIAHEVAWTSLLPLHVIDLPQNGGIGVAVQTGYLFAAQRGMFHFVIQFDADGQHDAAAIVSLVEACESRGLDTCIGSRFLGQDEGFRSTFTRRIGIRFLSMLISSLAGTRVTDPTSGFRCVGPRVWRAFARRYPDDYPEPESLYWCIRNGLQVGEIPVVMYERQGGLSSIRALMPVYYMLKVTLSILIDLLRRQEVQA
ncbi:MAG TPA: glycosyltransferase family 2 protein [Pirellulaceae bacterium]|nr:glycosyltransferase family 2 protein [Pirellulaceae bacterium]